MIYNGTMINDKNIKEGGGNQMYFATDDKARTIHNDKGDIFTVEQFKKILKNSTKPIDMTLMTQRLVRYDFDFDRLDDYYNQPIT